MRGFNVNVYFSEANYNKIKPLIRQRKISAFVNQVVERELERQQKEQLKKQLIQGYQAQAKNERLQEELISLENAQFENE